MGVHAEYVNPALPSKTAPAHAAIWTGAYADVNGISGNTVPVLPRAEHTLLESFDGFDSRVLRAEPIWMAALRAGKKVVGLSVTHQTPANIYTDVMRQEGIPAGRYASFDGFRTQIDDARVLSADQLSPGQAPGTRETSVSIGETLFKITVFDARDDRVKGYDSARICSGSECVTLKPAEAQSAIANWSKPFRVQRGDLFGLAYFRLFSLAPDAGEMTLYASSVAALQGAASPELTERFMAASGGFPDFGFAAYDKGRLGRQIYSGGDGTAERRLLEAVRFGMSILDRGMRYAIEQMHGELIIDYTAALDTAGHRWMGALDPDSGVYNDEMAAKIWPFYTEILQIQDAWLGHILDLGGSDSIVSVISDHGMEGVGRSFYPNVVLERAGLLARTPEDKIDLTKTRVCAPPWGEYFLSVNSTDWKGGIVRPQDREAVLNEATQALLNAVDPETGSHIVTRVFRADNLTGLGGGGLSSGDLFMDFAPGYMPSSLIEPSTVVRKLNLSIGSGTHGFFPLDSKMQTIWFATGPGIVAGKEIGPIRQIDIAPTLSRLFGIPAPANAKGHVIGEVFQRW